MQDLILRDSISTGIEIKGRSTSSSRMMESYTPLKYRSQETLLLIWHSISTCFTKSEKAASSANAKKTYYLKDDVIALPIEYV